jgi:hypothetical protein
VVQLLSAVDLPLLDSALLAWMQQHVAAAGSALVTSASSLWAALDALWSAGPPAACRLLQLAAEQGSPELCGARAFAPPSRCVVVNV